MRPVLLTLYAIRRCVHRGRVLDAGELLETYSPADALDLVRRGCCWPNDVTTAEFLHELKHRPAPAAALVDPEQRG